MSKECEDVLIEAVMDVRQTRSCVSPGASVLQPCRQEGPRDALCITCSPELCERQGQSSQGQMPEEMALSVPLTALAPSALDITGSAPSHPWTRECGRGRVWCGHADAKSQSCHCTTEQPDVCWPPLQGQPAAGQLPWCLQCPTEAWKEGGKTVLV